MPRKKPTPSETPTPAAVTDTSAAGREPSRVSIRLEKNVVWCGGVRIGYIAQGESGVLWEFLMRSEALNAHPMGHCGTAEEGTRKVARALTGWLRAAGLGEYSVTVEAAPAPPETPRKRAEKLI